MDWLPHLEPLFKKYGKRKHPLEYENTYQLVVMVVLSAQSSDAMINKIAPQLFAQYPSMQRLATAAPEDLFPLIKSVRGFRKKADWLVRIAQALRNDKNIPLTVDALTDLPGIGRKSANVIIREAGGEPQGIFVDLHVLRVIPRLGISTEEKPEKVEKDLLKIIPKNRWHAAGMSFSYLGRELCRPTEPRCPECLMQRACAYYRNRQTKR
jgi:endonuclease-3